jgi:hypothetical protein
LAEDGTVVYKWNSLVYDKFKIAPGLDSVSVQGTALTKIVTVDLYTRQLSLPSEFNKTIAYVGDYGTNMITFRMDRFLNGIDFMNSQIIVKYTAANGVEGQSKITKGPRLLEDLNGNENDDLLEFDWVLSNTLTKQSGPIEIIITLLLIREIDSKTIGYVWNSAPFSQFEIGKGRPSDFEGAGQEDENGLLIIDEEQLLALLKEEYGYVFPTEV